MWQFVGSFFIELQGRLGRLKVPRPSIVHIGRLVVWPIHLSI
jgi:hypothetical protein